MHLFVVSFFFLLSSISDNIRLSYNRYDFLFIYISLVKMWLSNAKSSVYYTSQKISILVKPNIALLYYDYTKNLVKYVNSF